MLKLSVIVDGKNKDDLVLNLLDVISEIRRSESKLPDYIQDLETTFLESYIFYIKDGRYEDKHSFYLDIDGKARTKYLGLYDKKEGLLPQLTGKKFLRCGYTNRLFCIVCNNDTDYGVSKPIIEEMENYTTKKT